MRTAEPHDCSTATLHDFVLRALALRLSCPAHLVVLGDNGLKSLDIPVDYKDGMAYHWPHGKAP
jgi:hypothetical protein